MKKILYPNQAEWAEILKRPVLNMETLRGTVCEVLDKVKAEGDKAVIEYEERFDKVKLEFLAVTDEEMKEAVRPYKEAAEKYGVKFALPKIEVRK